MQKTMILLTIFGKLGCFWLFLAFEGISQNTGLKKAGTFGTLGTFLENIRRKVFQKVFRSGTTMEQFGTKLLKCSSKKMLGTDFGTDLDFLFN